MPQPAECVCVVCGCPALRLDARRAVGRCPNCGLLARLGEMFGREIPGAGACVPEAEAAKRSVYLRGLALLERAAPGRRLLDVGAGSGFFLGLASARQWSAAGVEPDEKQAAFGRDLGRDIHSGFLEDLSGDGGFHAITLWDVLDLMRDPVGALTRAGELLTSGGVVLVRVRNAPIHQFVAERLDSLLGCFMHRPATLHRFGFGERSLRAAFERAGFSVLLLGNSPLTAGDPYGTGKAGGAVGVWLIKTLVGAGSWIVERLSFGRLFCGPTLWALARRETRLPSVLHLITRLDPGGSTECIRHLVREWKGEEAHLILAAGPGLSGSGDDSVILLRHLRRDPSWQDLLAVFEIRRLLRGLRPAALHTHSSKAGFLGRWAAWLAGVPVTIHSPHGHVFYGYWGTPRSCFYLLLEKLCVPLTDRFVALTEGEKRESLEFGLGTPSQWSVIPSGTPLLDGTRLPAKPELRKRLGLAPDGVWVGSLMRLERVKGPDVLMEAAALLAEEATLRFVVLGDGPMRTGLEARIEALGLAGRFILAGHQEDITSWLGALDIYVQPSRNEGMGRSLIQAHAMNLPIVASRVCGIPDVVVEEKSALLVPPEDPMALAEGIRALAHDPERRSGMGRRGHDWLLEEDDAGCRRFSPETMVELHRRLYRRVLGET